ncbi:hypothetical protein HA41_14810 [Pantoea conspicua]|uniref:Uncharacterized protein n=1 Tax=Pantoea conspicua TaxID=472705 RepID=A0A1X1BTM0_9GAMM|nr:hypothetical protein HA41_14810 [Pantoea conspicua]
MVNVLLTVSIAAHFMTVIAKQICVMSRRSRFGQGVMPPLRQLSAFCLQRAAPTGLVITLSTHQPGIPDIIARLMVLMLFLRRLLCVVLWVIREVIIGIN